MEFLNHNNREEYERLQLALLREEIEMKKINNEAQRLANQLTRLTLPSPVQPRGWPAPAPAPMQAPAPMPAPQTFF